MDIYDAAATREKRTISGMLPWRLGVKRPRWCWLRACCVCGSRKRWGGREERPEA